MLNHSCALSTLFLLGIITFLACPSEENFCLDFTFFSSHTAYRLNKCQDSGVLWSIYFWLFCYKAVTVQGREESEQLWEQDFLFSLSWGNWNRVKRGAAQPLRKSETQTKLLYGAPWCRHCLVKSSEVNYGQSRWVTGQTELNCIQAAGCSSCEQCVSVFVGTEPTHSR